MRDGREKENRAKWKGESRREEKREEARERNARCFAGEKGACIKGH